MLPPQPSLLFAKGGEGAEVALLVMEKMVPTSLSNKAKTPWQRGIFKGLLYAVMVVVSVLLMINVHEIGHTVFARLFGDAHATYTLYQVRSDDRLACIGCNLYNEAALSWTGHVVVALGGVIFSQALALLILWYGKRAKPQRCWPFCKILAAVCAFDAVFQALQGLLADTAHQTGLIRVDIADFVWLVSWRTGIHDGFIKVIIGAVLLVYLWWFTSTYRKVGMLLAKERSL